MSGDLDHRGATVTHRLRVRYSETDRMGVAHHGSCLAWFEAARTEWLRARGKTYRQLEDEGNLLQVVSLVVDYHRPVDYDDEVLVRVGVKERGKVALTFAYEVVRADTGVLVTTGETRLACVGRDGRPRRLPPGL